MVERVEGEVDRLDTALCAAHPRFPGRRRGTDGSRCIALWAGAEVGLPCGAAGIRWAYPGTWLYSPAGFSRTSSVKPGRGRRGASMSDDMRPRFPTGSLGGGGWGQRVRARVRSLCMEPAMSPHTVPAIPKASSHAEIRAPRDCAKWAADGPAPGHACQPPAGDVSTHRTVHWATHQKITLKGRARGTSGVRTGLT